MAAQQSHPGTFYLVVLVAADCALACDDGGGRWHAQRRGGLLRRTQVCLGVGDLLLALVLLPPDLLLLHLLTLPANLAQLKPQAVQAHQGMGSAAKAGRGQA